MTTTVPVERRIEPLARHHDRAAFSSGESALDIYLQRQASQEVRRRFAAVFVLVGDQPEVVAGYYTLSATAIDAHALPVHIVRKLPHYTKVPATLLGRLARDLRYRGQGMGERLLMNALWQALAGSGMVGSFAVVVDALNERAASFYRRFGFQPLSDAPMRLYLPLTTVEGLLPA